jgi:hypothetical protein
MSNGERLTRPPGMTDADFDLIERFVTAFNRVDRHLRELYKADDRISFGRLVEIHLRKNPHWRDADALRSFKAVRNVIIHERDLPYRYMFVPTLAAVEEIEKVRDRLVSPESLIPRFRRHVVQVAADDTAAKVLCLVHKQGGSKFPVFDDERFRGLLTEHGITRWLAWRVSSDGTQVDLTAVTALEMLAQEEDARNVEFLAADASTEDLLRTFAMNPVLQAVLITNTGLSTEPLLGLATWGDALRLLGEQ